MYNFLEIKTMASRLVQRSDDSDYILNNIGDAVNLSLKFLYDSYDYFIELKTKRNFTSVSGTRLYYMPTDFEKPMRIYDITNDKRIILRTEEEYTDGNIASVADSTTGNVNYAYPVEVVGVKAQVSSSGDTIQAKSSSANDTSVVIRVEGYLDSNLTILGYENVTVTGTSAVSGTTTFYKITRYSKASDTVGYLTLEDSSANELGVLSQNERIARYTALGLALIPDDSVTNYRVFYKKKFTKLVDDNDYPFVDADNYLIFNAAAISLEQNKDNIQYAQSLQRRADKAYNGIILNQSTKMGDDFQSKMVSGIMQAHRG